MVKHPKYQAMDDARERIIPELFEKHCRSKGYKLEILHPNEDVRTNGPISRPDFKIYNESNEPVAYFQPNGFAECFKDEFKHFFDKMLQEMEAAAAKALAEYEQHQ